MLSKCKMEVRFIMIKLTYHTHLRDYLNVEIDQIADPLKKAIDVSNLGHYSPGKTEVTL